MKRPGWSRKRQASEGPIDERLEDVAEEHVPEVDAAYRIGWLLDDMSWVNRRVETVEMLSQEETRRRVAVDFTLTEESWSDLEVDYGCVIPLGLLGKASLSHLDVEDEAGRSIPILSKGQNRDLTGLALMWIARHLLDDDLLSEAFLLLAGDLSALSHGDEKQGRLAFSAFGQAAENGDVLKARLWENQRFRELMELLTRNYILYAVLEPGGARRRIIKFSYGNETRFGLPRYSWSGGLTQFFSDLWQSIWWPDMRWFNVECSALSRTSSYHLEVAFPDDLRADRAALFDLDSSDRVSSVVRNKNRLSLYAEADTATTLGKDLHALIAFRPERLGRLSAAAGTSILVAGLLWFGVASGLDAETPSAAVTTILTGMAVFSGWTAVKGENSIVVMMLSYIKKYLALVLVAAVVASASLALEFPDCETVTVWKWCAIASTVAALRLTWSAVRASGKIVS